MRDNLRVITPATDLAVTLDDAKSHLRVEDSDQDELVQAYIEAAQQSLAYLGRALMPASYALDLYRWRRAVELPMPPLRSVSAVKVVGADGTLATTDSANYSVTISAEGRGLVYMPGAAWGLVGLEGKPIVSIEFSAGYDTVPAAIRAAILLIAGSLFDNRASVSPVSVYSVPGIERLVAPYAESHV